MSVGCTGGSVEGVASTGAGSIWFRSARTGSGISPDFPGSFREFIAVLGRALTGLGAIVPATAPAKIVNVIARQMRASRTQHDGRRLALAARRCATRDASCVCPAAGPGDKQITPTLLVMGADHMGRSRGRLWLAGHSSPALHRPQGIVCLAAADLDHVHDS